MANVKKFGPGKYGYGQWIIEYFPEEKIWLMFPPGQVARPMRLRPCGSQSNDRPVGVYWLVSRSATHIKVGPSQIYKV